MDIEALNNIKNTIDEDTQNINNMLDSVVSSYSSGLDELMNVIFQDVISVEEPATKVIEKYFLELSNAIYFVDSKTEKLGIYNGVGKLNLKEKYNNIYLSSLIGNDGKKRTATELTSISENGSKYESIMSDIYDKAYKILKAKISAAETMTSTLSKVFSYRMQQEASASVGEFNTTKKILNEGL